MHVKKSLFVLLLAVGMLSSCSISKSAMKDRKTIDGYWILNSVSYTGAQGTFKSQLFNDASSDCFEGSSWYFRNNNSTGSYVLSNSPNCGPEERFIRWSILERDGFNSQIQFKFVDDKYKDISGGQGYRLDIASLSETHMRLESKVSVEGTPVTVVYEFIKND
ncbi:lipocalin-like domain-containing protein [Arenibacter latericius]|uniref:lipocalin family protein n=1 Tax=Arenibacter latericius TaxID=86104 RepID=UPI000478EA51|nr:lipocalin family protein [Arenibacter latericius]MDX1363511.1 lipocalin family protein [Arenibacter latericius]